MLEGLDEIDWSKLHHAYGEANDVPELIRALLSDNVEKRERAIHELFGNIWHQGTIYEASPWTIPFLYELLEIQETPDKLSVALLLSSLATGTYYFHHTLSKEKDRSLWQQVLAKEGRSLEKEIEDGIRYENDVRNAIKKKFFLLYPYLFCKEPVIRDSVAKAFGEYLEFKSETLSLLEKALEIETDEFAKESIENSIKILKETE